MTAARLHVHTTSIKARWCDMDALGHVNNSVYFSYMEQARVEWMNTQLESAAHLEGQGNVIVNASCSFLVPLIHPAEIEVRMYLASPGRTSVGSFYDIFSNGKKHADGAAKIVWIDLATGRPVPLPEHIVAPLRSLTIAKS